MELYACGMNAWNQLQFQKKCQKEDDQFKVSADITAFTCVLQASQIEMIYVGLSETIVKTGTSTFQHAGLADAFSERFNADPLNYRHVAMAANGKVADTNLSQYASLSAYPRTHPQPNNTALAAGSQIHAGHTHFACLLDGKVWTWGDPRFAEFTLGRELDLHEAAVPGVVTALDDADGGIPPVVKIGTAAYVTAALTSSGDLYVWGVSTSITGNPLPVDLRGDDFVDGQPKPLDFEGRDVVDFTCGERHLVVVTEDHKVWVIGEGGNGQLGAGLERLLEWSEVVVELPPGRKIVGVGAGPKSSLVLVKLK